MSFNEAPALHGGKRADLLDSREHRVASMRPPHYTGENWSLMHMCLSLANSFNEAPALHGGKRNPEQGEARCRKRFNEAPALHGGKLGVGGYVVSRGAELQ